MRFPLEVFEAVRAVFPAEKPVWMRISATDWVPDGWTVEGTVVELWEERAAPAYT